MPTNYTPQPMLNALEWVGILWVCGGCFLPLAVLGQYIADRLDRLADQRGRRA